MLGRRGRKERKRLMALLLAGAMVLSGMGISPISVQAEETEPVVEQVSETVSDGNAETAREVLGEEKVLRQLRQHRMRMQQWLLCRVERKKTCMNWI